LARIKAKVKSGQTHVVTQEGEEAPEPRQTGAEVIDLVALLQRSLAHKGKGKDKANAEEKEAPRRAAARKPASRLSTGRAGSHRKRA
jgi:non-homologous end joining protein Ku